ncbi:hypothetical protein Anapl_14803 [Anas platyrhynchos]|uniref:Uncharacterized protein n=1 Tax=Anas platyrhynchos TaxID=8839 RepID=R0JII8_ANAPL|nr:hypothetical protein Anapl_14803 [Anas platyrhynchos]
MDGYSISAGASEQLRFVYDEGGSSVRCLECDQHRFVLEGTQLPEVLITCAGNPWGFKMKDKIQLLKNLAGTKQKRFIREAYSYGYTDYSNNHNEFAIISISEKGEYLIKIALNPKGKGQMIPSRDSSGQPLLLSLSFLPNDPLANSSVSIKQSEGLGEGVILTPDQSYLTDQETTDHEQDVKWKSMSDLRTERKAEIFTPPKIGGGEAYDSHELQALGLVLKCAFCESSSKETTATQLAVTANISEIPSNAIILTSCHALVLSRCLAKDNYDDRVIFWGKMMVFGMGLPASLQDSEQHNCPEVVICPLARKETAKGPLQQSAPQRVSPRQQQFRTSVRLAEKLLKQKILVKYSEGQLQEGDARCFKNKASSSCTGLEQEWSTAEGDEFKSKLRGRSLLIIKLHINRWYLCKSGSFLLQTNCQASVMAPSFLISASSRKGKTQSFKVCFHAGVRELPRPLQEVAPPLRSMAQLFCSAMTFRAHLRLL